LKLEPELKALLAQPKKSTAMTTTEPDKTLNGIGFQSGHQDANGIRMYYEIYGQGFPLVLIHGGGSTIQTTFGRIIPELVRSRKLICVELQAHGRTGDRNAGLSFEQDADDVAALLGRLEISKADIFGFSNGGNTALQIAIRHPEICRKVIGGSVLLKRNGTFPQFWAFMENGTFGQMPQPYKDAFLAVTPDHTKLLTMYQKCADRMIQFQDFSDDQIRSIQAPVLLINGDADVATSAHIVAMSGLIPGCNLAILPGGHGEYMGEITTAGSNNGYIALVAMLIEKYLSEIC
jgi:pimeloyl-ACP methyl ester carboxylesterase